MRAAYSAREARADDLAMLRHVEHAASQMFLGTDYPEIADEPTTPTEEFARWLEQRALFVAVDAADVAVGFAIAFALDGDAYLHEIDVHPAHSRRGVGRLLIEYVGAWAERRGHARITLSTFTDVAWNAPYYRRLGFHEIPDNRLGPGLLEVRRREIEAGLNVARRVFMALRVGRLD